MFRKKEPDAFERLNNTIDRMYRENPYIGELHIRIYRADLDKILKCMEICVSDYSELKSLINNKRTYCYFRGIKMTIAENQNKEFIIGHNLSLDTTNLVDNSKRVKK